MGLNIGVRVKRQPEGYMQYGRNPKGTLEEIGARLQAHLEEKMGGNGFGANAELRNDWYTFDIRVSAYGQNLPHEKTSYDLMRELVIWVWEQFSDEEGVEMKTYWVG